MISESTVINALAADIRELDGDHTKGAGELAEALVAKGWIQTDHIPQAISTPAEPVPEYTPNEPVEILIDGTWTAGSITEIAPYGLIHVYTERGSRTVYPRSTKLRHLQD